MAIVRESNIEILVAPATIFNKDIQTREVKLDNYQAAHFVVASGEGVERTVTARVYGTDGDGSLEIAEQEIVIGGNQHAKIVIVARQLTHDEFDSVFLTIENANANDIVGTIFVVLTNERYAY